MNGVEAIRRCAVCGKKIIAERIRRWPHVRTHDEICSMEWNRRWQEDRENMECRLPLRPRVGIALDG